MFLPGCGIAGARKRNLTLAYVSEGYHIMAPLPPNSTPRFRFHYTCIGKQHSLQVRSNASPAVIGGVIDDFFNALGAAVASRTLDFVDFAPSGLDVFNPVTTGFEGTVYGAVPGVTEQAPWAYTFLGRSSGGRRIRMAVFGALFLGDDYRIEAAVSPTVAAAIAVLVAAAGNIHCIDGLTPVWKQYVDCQVNDHWVKVLRP